jgi:hypothetical protein
MPKKRPITFKCVTSGCETEVLAENTRCGKCNATLSPIEVVNHLSRVELEVFKGKELELLSIQKDIRILDLEMEICERKVKEELEKLQRNLEQLRKQHTEKKAGKVSEFNSKQASYKTFVSDLAKRFSLDPQKMSIDMETGVLHDLRETQT